MLLPPLRCPRQSFQDPSSSCLRNRYWDPAQGTRFLPGSNLNFGRSSSPSLPLAFWETMRMRRYPPGSISVLGSTGLGCPRDATGVKQKGKEVLGR
ncbi:homeobox protein BarH-like 1 isoform X2 [Alosa sapidissima]|uniref:homeobox protein BarH-like 1 isoform X2 n=1 Tax=Alosa sapidissima TaxID=34773 RepID=UPI001C0885A8|nr:homeobox protein BarH-like 1 isoform X2 [Alosa sapidissima]